MSGLVEQLGFKKKIHVGVSLSANNFIELVCIDEKTKSVIKYASGNIKYNNAIREIIDYDEFSEVYMSEDIIYDEDAKTVSKYDEDWNLLSVVEYDEDGETFLITNNYEENGDYLTEEAEYEFYTTPI